MIARQLKHRIKVLTVFVVAIVLYFLKPVNCQEENGLNNVHVLVNFLDNIDIIIA